MSEPQWRCNIRTELIGGPQLKDSTRLISFRILKRCCEYTCFRECMNEAHPDYEGHKRGRCRQAQCPIWRRLAKPKPDEDTTHPTTAAYLQKSGACAHGCHPMSQPPDAAALIRYCPECGMVTAIDMEFSAEHLAALQMPGQIVIDVSRERAQQAATTAGECVCKPKEACP